MVWKFGRINLSLTISSIPWPNSKGHDKLVPIIFLKFNKLPVLKNLSATDRLLSHSGDYLLL